ncbi:hypothetical protein KR222_002897, partial [Zaprionus bogoriensis]
KMPCFTRERSLSLVLKRDKSNQRDVMAPKPVRPRAMRFHGFLSASLVAQHLIADDKWTPDSLSEQFINFTQLLSKYKGYVCGNCNCIGTIRLLERRVIYKQHETRSNRKKLAIESKRLKTMCIDGRLKLQKFSTGNNAINKIRSMLSNHRGMQRLYQSMPIHLVADNINQRTFVLRKERDRLICRLNQMKAEYKSLLLDRAEVQNRLRYQGAHLIQEEVNSRVLMEKIENSNVRMKAIATINTTYKKLIQILLRDEIFYDPILRSLEGDMEDQASFIKHLLYLGKPAIIKFKELEKQYQMLQLMSHKNLHAKMEMLASLKKPPTVFAPPADTGNRMTVAEKVQHYTRQTKSMTELKEELERIEGTIKELKYVTLCSQAKEIFPRWVHMVHGTGGTPNLYFVYDPFHSIRQQLENNRNLTYVIEKHRMHRQALRNKRKYTDMLQQVLMNNLSEEELNRIEHVKGLKSLLQADVDFEEENLRHIRERGNLYVLFRMMLWNLIDILRHVDHQPKTFRPRYQSSYLKLPFLKFEMFNMIAAAPELYEEDQEKIMALLKLKVYKLMKKYKREMGPEIENSKNRYHVAFMQTLEKPENLEGDQQDIRNIDDDDSTKNLNIPSRKQIKAQSARVLETAKRGED